jgi:hypothetical protein
MATDIQAQIKEAKAEPESATQSLAIWEPIVQSPPPDQRSLQAEAATCRSPGSVDCPGFFYVAVKAPSHGPLGRSPTTRRDRPQTPTGTVER